jgi:hypothetical protein
MKKLAIALFFSIFFILIAGLLQASAQGIESISLSDLENTVQKPFIYTIENSFPNPFIINGGRSILYQPDPNSLSIYDYFYNKKIFNYSINGLITSVDESFPILVVGTDKGEVLVLDESNGYSPKKFEGSFGAVKQVLALGGKYAYVLFSDGSMLQYDVGSDSWIAYRSFALNVTTEKTQQYQVLRMWKDGGNILLLCMPVYTPIGKIYIQLSPATNATSVAGVGVILNFTDTGFVLSSKTDESGYAEFSVPPGESASAFVQIYIASEKAGFYYLISYTLGELMNKLSVFTYPPSNAPLVSVKIAASNYVLYSASPSSSGLNFVNNYSFTADSVNDLLILDGSLGFKYILLDSKGGAQEITRLTSSLVSSGKDTFSRTEVTALDSDASGRFLVLGFSDGTLIAFRLDGGSYSAFQSYKLSSQPVLLHVSSSSPLSVITYDGIYLQALRYNQNNFTLWPILRGESYLGYIMGGVEKAYMGTEDTALFFTGTETIVLDGVLETYSYYSLDLRTRTLSTVTIYVNGEDGSIPSSFSATLEGRIVYSQRGGGGQPIVFRNVLPENYTLRIVPDQNIYDPISIDLHVTGSGSFNATLPLHVFNVTFALIDSLTNGPPKGSFVYIVNPPRGNATSGTWIPSEGPLSINATYGKYTMTLSPEYSSIYSTFSISFSVPENLSLSLSIDRHPFVYGVQVLDSTSKAPAIGSFLVEIVDTLGVSHSAYTDLNSIAYVSLNDVGNMNISVTPADDATSKIYKSASFEKSIYFQVVSPFYINRNNYTLTLIVKDLDTNIPASGANVKIGPYSQTVGPNGTLQFVLPAGNYTVTVQGGIYATAQKAILLSGNVTQEVGVRRILGTITVRVYQAGGTPIANAIVSIDGIDNINTFTFVTDYTGEISTNIPLGLYKITVTASDYVTQTKVWNISNTTPQLVEVKMNYTVLGYFKAYGIYILVIIVAAALILYMRRYVKKRLDVLAQKELEEVF